MKTLKNVIAVIVAFVSCLFSTSAASVMFDLLTIGSSDQSFHYLILLISVILAAGLGFFIQSILVIVTDSKVGKVYNWIYTSITFTFIVITVLMYRLNQLTLAVSNFSIVSVWIFNCLGCWIRTWLFPEKETKKEVPSDILDMK
ncbi:hypothetical protein OO013_07305 [Mangrovivirga sp. M17]|uniref:DUF4293 family protein n=1 Tax=Mangrovivirga halotolerans TaxID=2993936 RepID=A0ABT3RR48_9BACT|nr:hypothetical protein [Mangrovivirga halotolerans]MCX2743665.1 hypothetical protein [Mangrovivirga halotolerans]